MIPEIKRILYTTDLSENARYAFGYAASLANRYDAKIVILNVLQDVSPSADSMVINVIGQQKWDELRKENEQHVLDMIKARLEKFCDDVRNELPSCPFITDEIIVKTGHPVDKILDLVEAKNCDMVVMGAHGHRILEHAMMGSTTRWVVKRCKKPVLVVRLPD